MINTYKLRLYPTEAQKDILNTTLETCRRLYNDSLGERIADRDVGFYEQKQLLVLRKQDNKYYKQVHSQVLQDVVLRLDKAYQAFLKKVSRYPRFRRRERYNSFCYPQHGGFILKRGRLVLSRIGAIEMKMHRIPIGTLKRCTIIRDIDQWYCCITSDDGIEQREAKAVESVIGVDVGLLNWITLSNGEKIESTIDLKSEVEKIRRLQARLSRKKKGSKNRERARIALAKQWRHVRRTRDDFVHKTSKNLADNYQTLVFEKLNINNMVKNHSLAKAIMEVTWGKLRLYTAYKVGRRGGQVIVVNPNGTSQKCSGANGVVRKDLSIRVHECTSCGVTLDRDHNAALNILKLGLEQAHAETEPLLVRQRISKFQSRKQEAQVFSLGSSPERIE